MRVLHIGKYYPPVPGGMEYFLRDLLVALDRKGISVGALVHQHKAGLPSSYDLIEKIPVWRAKILGHTGFVPVALSFQNKLIECIRKFKPHILHFHMPNASAFLALCIPQARKIPWVVHWHSDVIPSEFNMLMKILYPGYAAIEQIFLRKAKVVIATSPDYLNASNVIKKFRSKCSVIPLGIDRERLSRSKNSLAIQWAEQVWGSTSFRLLSVGRLTYYKGFDLLIKAMVHLPENISLHIVGTGVMEKFLKSLAQKSGVQERVVFHGYLTDEYLSALFSTCDCFVLGSFERTEAFGIVLLEAMWHEKPIIASNIHGSGVRWIMGKARCGLLFEPRNVMDCVSKILWMKNHPAEAAQYGKSGRTFLEDNLLIDHIANKVVSIYETLT